jgi:hypothetical protein
MSTSTILIAAALIASCLLFGLRKSRGAAIGACVVAAVALLMALGFLHISVPHIGLAIGAALAGLGVLLVLRADRKQHVIAATVLASSGAMLLLQALR